MLRTWILGLSCAIAFAAHAAPSVSCEPPERHYHEIGPAMSVEQLEAKYLDKMKDEPEVPQVPFGYSNGEWLKLKAALKPGDTLHEFRSAGYGGIVVLRRGCAVGELLEWIS